MVCKLMKRSRQSYYKGKAAVAQVCLTEDKLLNLVQPIRQLMPRIGGKKLYSMIHSKLEGDVPLGRDKFFIWLKRNDLLIRHKKRYVSTTQSNHRFWVRTSCG
jgi:putative transposase